jgi:rod shape determining protein RodA
MLMPEFKKTRIDKVVLTSVLLFSLFSLLAVYSATYSSDTESVRDNFNKQLFWVGAGLVIFYVTSRIPAVAIYSSSYALYGILTILLILIDFFGAIAGGGQRWFSLAGFKLQPSEFMKPVLVLTLAHYLSVETHSPNRIRHLLVTFVLALVPFVLVIKQPDLGTALVYLSVLIPMLYWRGLSPFTIFVLVAPMVSFIASFHLISFFIVIFLISAVLYLARRGKIVAISVFVINILVGLFSPVVWNGLHGYQQQRIMTFLGLVSDPKGVGYQIIQSKVAIGSGGILGKGLLQGTQTQLRFLPAQHTDFIFSVLAEEWGFWGSLAVLLTFFFFLQRCIKIASSANHRFASLLSIGLVTTLAFQIVLNIGMTMGVAPVTGVPLPFISYGGSAMLTNMAIAGMICNAANQ